MCNHYRNTSTIDGINQLVQTFNRPNYPAGDYFPKYPAPVLRRVDAGNELAIVPWGVPCVIQGKTKNITNVRNLTSNFWRSMLARPEWRCLVPATAFSEWTDEPDPIAGKRVEKWFEITDQPTFFFAGLWRPTEEGERFAFLTTAPNSIVAPIHKKAMPVVLRPEDWEAWLSADYAGACALAMQYPADRMRVL